MPSKPGGRLVYQASVVLSSAQATLSHWSRQGGYSISLALLLGQLKLTSANKVVMIDGGSCAQAVVPLNPHRNPPTVGAVVCAGQQGVTRAPVACVYLRSIAYDRGRGSDESF